jgi:hypothetical protein
LTESKFSRILWTFRTFETIIAEGQEYKSVHHLPQLQLPPQSPCFLWVLEGTVSASSFGWFQLISEIWTPQHLPIISVSVAKLLLSLVQQQGLALRSQNVLPMKEHMLSLGNIMQHQHIT